MTRRAVIDKLNDLANGYLQTLPVSTRSRQNYLSDVSHFISWLEGFLSRENVDVSSVSDMVGILNRVAFEEYLKELRQSSTPKVTISRRMTTMRHVSRGLGMYGYDSDDKFEANKFEAEKNDQRSYIQRAYIRYAVVGALVVLAIAFHSTLNTPSVGRVSTAELEWAGNNIVLHENARRDIAVGAPVEIVLADSNSYSLQLDHVGHSILRAGNKQAIVMTDIADADSFILVSPTSSTGGAQIYISDQGEGYFIVSVDNASVHDISFNWLVK